MMGDHCELSFEKAVYSPGEVIEGALECSFLSDTTIKAVRLQVTGNGRVSWKVSRYTYHRAHEVYLEQNVDLLSIETETPAGRHIYRFSYQLPPELPSSMSHGDPTYLRDIFSLVLPVINIDVHYGCIEYNVTAVVERAWALKCECTASFCVLSLPSPAVQTVPSKPVEITKSILPTSSVVKKMSPITVHATMAGDIYRRGEDISFALSVKNASVVDIQYIQFQFVQGFVFHADEHTKNIDAFVGDDCIVKDSSLAGNTERDWNLVMRVPDNMFVGDFTRSNIIKVFWELRGEISLPFPNKNFYINLPFNVNVASSN